MHIRCFGLIMSFVRGGAIFFTSTLGGVKLFLSWLRGGTGFLGPKIAGIGILGENPQPVTGFRAKMNRDPGWRTPLPPSYKRSLTSRDVLYACSAPFHAIRQLGTCRKMLLFFRMCHIPRDKLGHWEPIKLTLDTLAPSDCIRFWYIRRNLIESACRMFFLRMISLWIRHATLKCATFDYHIELGPNSI